MSSENIQPMHQLQSQKNPLHRQLFGKSVAAQNFASPTDSIMSPCSAKLQAHKNKHLNRAKPQMLFRQESQSEEEQEQEQDKSL